MTTAAKKPPIPADVDLRDFSFTPIFRKELFKSAFHKRANAEEWRAAMILMLKSWDELPAGSLPADDFALCQIVELDLDAWKHVREVALDGWYQCDDGHLYNNLVTEGVMAAYVRRRMAAGITTPPYRNVKAAPPSPDFTPASSAPPDLLHDCDPNVGALDDVNDVLRRMAAKR